MISWLLALLASSQVPYELLALVLFCILGIFHGFSYCGMDSSGKRKLLEPLANCFFVFVVSLSETKNFTQYGKI